MMMRVLGLMSGTSMDGVDAALVETDGVEEIRFLSSVSLPYPPEIRRALLAARGWEPQPEAEAVVLEWHGARLKDYFDAPDLIGFHGQTVAHDPKGGRTRQLGDGAALANAWGAPVVWDFRSDDMAAGGEGAPLAPFYHFHLLRSRGLRGRVVVLNLGGVGNVTWTDLDKDDPMDDGAILAFDTGPANAPIDDTVAQHFGKDFDARGEIAARGQVDEKAIRAFLMQPFFGAPPPKSLDRDALLPRIDQFAKPEDKVATLTAASAAAVASAAQHFPAPADHWFVTGGGRHNPTLVGALVERVGAPMASIDTLGLDGDMLEAQAFAWLAVRVLNGAPTSAPATTRVSHPVSGGRVSRPET